MKRPMTTKDHVPIGTYQFDLKHNLAYGCNEGISKKLYDKFYFLKINLKAEKGCRKKEIPPLLSTI